MPRAIVTAQRAFPFVLALTFIVAIMPAQALGWTRFPAEFLGIFVNPFAQVGNRMSSWLRPPPTSSLIAGMTRDDVDRLLQDKAEAEQLLRAERIRVDLLQLQLDQLQKISIDHARKPMSRIIAPIGIRAPASALGAVMLGRGTNHGVKPRAVAVYDGDQLLGRVGDEVSAMQCKLIPLVSKETGTFAGMVVTGRNRDDSVAHSRAIPIDPGSDGTFIAQVDKVEIVNAGDQVVLNDNTWPESAQGLTIGVVERVFTNDMEPLRNTIIIRPRLLLSQVSFVVLKAEAENGDSAAAPKAAKP